MQESVATPPVSAGAVGAPKTSPRLGHIGGQSQGPDRRGGAGAGMAHAHAHDRGRGAVVTTSRTGTDTRAAARAGSEAAGGDQRVPLAVAVLCKVLCRHMPLTCLAQDIVCTDA